MMKIIFTILLFLTCILQFISAQPTQAEIDKMIKDAKAEIEKLKKDPQYAEALKNMPDMDSLMKNMKKQNVSTGAKTKMQDSSLTKLPPPDTSLFKSLPIRTFTRAELISYLHNLNSKLSELLRNSYRTDIKNIPIDNITQSGTSIALWINGKTNESVLAALKAAETKPDNPTLLNNAGGILTNCGLGIYAIPVLQYILEQKPENNLVLNNLGQAYFAVGDYKKAERYLLACVSSYKDYPDANLALAHINNNRGNKGTAITYAENSLRGAYSTGAHYLLLKLKPNAKLMDYVRHRYKQPQYFNFHKYPLLPQCMKVEDAPVLKPQYDAYEKVISQAIEKYMKLEHEESKIANQTAKEIAIKGVKEQRIPYRPFGVFAIAVIQDLMQNEYTDKFIRYDKYKNNYYQEIKKIKDKYEYDIKKIDEKWDPLLEKLQTGSSEDMAASEKICKEKNEVGDLALAQCALLTIDFQKVTTDLYTGFLNDISYWSFLASMDEHGANVSYYNKAHSFLSVLKEINTSTFFFPCKFEMQEAEAKEPEVKQPDCIFPQKVVIPLGAVKLEVSCDGYKLEAGEGWIGKIEKNLTTGDLTIAFGLGGMVPEVWFNSGGVELGMELEAKSQLYITINKGHLTDWGILWEAEMKTKIVVGGVETTYGSEEALTVGFGSGVQMREGGLLKGMIDRMYPVQPDAQQINKNLPLYKK